MVLGIVPFTVLHTNASLVTTMPVQSNALKKEDGICSVKSCSDKDCCRCLNTNVSSQALKETTVLGIPGLISLSRISLRNLASLGS